MAAEPVSEDEDRRLIVERYTKGRQEILEQIDEWEDPKFELYHVTDRYGFIHKERLPDRLSQYENKLRLKETARSRKWLKMLDHWKDHVGTEKLRKRVYKGIPNQVRGKAWCFLMGVPQIRKEQEGRYRKMLEWGLEHSTDVRQIDLDVNRTFRNNIMFRERYNVKQQELFRILVAYSVYNSEIGYCQGMSQLTALLMMYLHDEEDVFWAVDRLMSDDRYAMHGFFIPGFPKLTRFSRHHDQVLKRFLRSVYKHFKRFDIDSTLYTLKWFFQCFLDRVPFSLTLRLWDCFMLDGEVILTGMSYTLLKLHKRTVVKKGMEELLEFLQVDLEKDFGYHDDEAITALAQSIAELRKSRMHLPRDPPPETEKPTRPFGFLLQSDNVSLYTMTDNQSTRGSIVLKHQDGASVLDSALTSSEEDLSPAQKQKAGQPDSDVTLKADRTLTEISQELKFIDSAINALNTPEYEESSIREGKERQLQSPSLSQLQSQTQNGTMEIVHMMEEMAREQFDSENSGKRSSEPCFESGEVVLTSATSVLVDHRGEAIDSQDFMQDWPDSRSTSPQKDTHVSPGRAGASDAGGTATAAVNGKTGAGERTSVNRRTSIPRLKSPRPTGYPADSWSTGAPVVKTPSFIPRVVRSPPLAAEAQQQVTISSRKEGISRRRVDAEKVRIFVPYNDDGGSGSSSSGGGSQLTRSLVVGASHGSNPLPAVDT